MRVIETTGRRWYQFRLRTLLALGLVLSLLFSGFAAKLEEETRGWEAIQAVGQSGGVVSHFGRKVGVSPTPPTIWTVLDGLHSVHDVNQVDYSGLALTEDHFLQLGEVPSLGVLVLDRCVIDDAGLEQLAQLDIETGKRRWYQVSLRRLLVIPIGIAALAALIAAITPGPNVPIEAAPFYSFLYAFRSHDPASWCFGIVVCILYSLLFLAAILRPNPLTLLLVLLAVAVWIAAGFAMAKCAAC